MTTDREAAARDLGAPLLFGMVLFGVFLGFIFGMLVGAGLAT